MPDLHDKLKRLLERPDLMTGAQWRERKEQEPPPSQEQPPVPPTSTAPVSRLREILDRHGMKGGQNASSGNASTTRGALEVDQIIPGTIIGDADNTFYRVRTEYDIGEMHGNLALGNVLDVLPEHVALAACDPDLDAFDPAGAVFIDTETSGLAGGTGTVPFLIGAGYFSDGRFIVEQCFMRDFDEEEAMLTYLEDLLRGKQAVVTYNGKSFDIPLLRTRFITNRIRFPLENARHLDLVHAARRFWKKRLGDCSLGNIEREVLGVQRIGDVPSSEIPQIWFDYLRSRDARPLEGVFYHHRMDILSLVTLTAFLSQSLEPLDGSGFHHGEDRLSLTRVHFRQRRYEDAVRTGTALLEIEDAPALRRECLELLALAYKRLGRWARMGQAWTTLVEEFPRDIGARIELAKFLEHRKRDLDAAQRVCQEALAYLEVRATLDGGPLLGDWYAEVFKNRLERLGRKQAKRTQSHVQAEPDNTDDTDYLV